MIIYPQSLVISAAAVGEPLHLPRILWHTYTRQVPAPLVVASSESIGGPKEMPLDPDTATHWQGSALPATWVIDLGTLQPMDYAAMAEHSFGSSGVGVLMETSKGDLAGSPPLQVWTPLGSEVMPADDSPLVFMDSLREARYVRITLTGVGAIPKMAVFYTGISLTMPMTPVLGHRPVTLSRRTQMHSAKSRGGQFLGRGIRETGVATSVTFQRLQQDFYREKVDPFVEAARKYPYFFVLNAEEYPFEVAFVQTLEDIQPSYSEWDFFSASWDMEGIGLQ